MNRIASQIRALGFLLAVVLFIGAPKVLASPHTCDEVCSSSVACEEECYINEMEYQNGNATTCLAYGVYDTSAVCCGDLKCEEDEAGYCEVDCGGTGGCYPAECNPSTRTGCSSGQVCNSQACCVDAPAGWGDPPKDPACYEDYCDDSHDCCGGDHCYIAYPGYFLGVCVPDIVH